MFNEQDHPRNEYGEFTYKDKARNAINKALGKIKMTPAEKIASVHIDFDKDNILPELNDSDLKKLDVSENKRVLFKKDVIDRNAEEHSDLTDEDLKNIITHALYLPADIFKANDSKPYFHFAKPIEITSKGKSEIGLALLDVDDSKEYFEIVHAHFVSLKGLERANRKTTKKG